MRPLRFQHDHPTRWDECAIRPTSPLQARAPAARFRSQAATNVPALRSQDMTFDAPGPSTWHTCTWLDLRWPARARSRRLATSSARVPWLKLEPKGELKREEDEGGGIAVEGDEQGRLDGEKLYQMTMRCTRNDGKKWRCSQPAVAGHRHCARHLKWQAGMTVQKKNTSLHITSRKGNEEGRKRSASTKPGTMPFRGPKAKWLQEFEREQQFEKSKGTAAGATHVGKQRWTARTVARMHT